MSISDIKSKTKIRIICAVLFWIATVAWAVFIFSMSADNGTESSEKSSTVVEFIANAVVPGYDEMSPEEKAEAIKPLSFPIRKLAHITEYAVLGLLSAAAVYFTVYRKGFLRRAVLPFIICVIYAASDEYHQSLVPGRGPSFTDVLIDSIGIILGIAFVIFVTESRLQSKNNTSEN